MSAAHDTNLADKLLEQREKFEYGARLLLGKFLEILPADFARLEFFLQQWNYDRITSFLRDYFDNAVNNEELLLQLKRELPLENMADQPQTIAMRAGGLEEIIKPTLGMTVNAALILGIVAAAGKFPPMWPLFAATVAGIGLGIGNEFLRSRFSSQQNMLKVSGALLDFIYLPTQFLAAVFVQPLMPNWNKLLATKLPVKISKSDYTLPDPLLALLNEYVPGFGNNLVRHFQTRAQDISNALQDLDPSDPYFERKRARVHADVATLERDWSILCEELEKQQPLEFCKYLQAYLKRYHAMQELALLRSGQPPLKFTRAASIPYDDTEEAVPSVMNDLNAALIAVQSDTQPSMSTEPATKSVVK